MNLSDTGTESSDAAYRMFLSLLREDVARLEQSDPSDEMEIHLAHESTSAGASRWGGFEAVRLSVLTAAALGRRCPASLVLGVHSEATVLRQSLPSGVLAHPAVQYVPLSKISDEKALARAVSVARTGVAAPMPAAFQQGSLEALRMALSGIAHCLQNVVPIVQTWVDAVRRQDVDAMPVEIPEFARQDQNETLERLAIFEPLARALSGGGVSLQPIVDDWHALVRAWKDLQGSFAESAIDDAPRDLQARLEVVQAETDRVMARIKETQARLRPVPSEQTR